jgi:hypothetical protein
MGFLLWTATGFLTWAGLAGFGFLAFLLARADLEASGCLPWFLSWRARELPGVLWCLLAGRPFRRQLRLVLRMRAERWREAARAAEAGLRRFHSTVRGSRTPSSLDGPSLLSAGSVRFADIARGRP